MYKSPCQLVIILLNKYMLMPSISSQFSLTHNTLLSSPRSKMKRQRERGVNNGVNIMNNPPKIEDVAAMVTMGKKKVKREADQKVGMSVKEEKKESRDAGGLVVGAGEMMMNWSWEEYMPWLGGVVDEQMSWGSTWLPDWDMDFMGEAFTALYSDVVWDDDIWNLKN